MAGSRFTESQIVAALREVEGGVPIAEVIRKNGISRATIFTWKSTYGGATVDETRAGLGRYLTLFDTRRRYSIIAETIPDEAYLLTLRSPLRVAA